MSSIAITGGATGTGVFSLLAPSTSTNRTLTLPDSTGTVVATGSTAVVSQAMLASGVAGNGPAFSAYNSTAQIISSGVWTKALFDTEEFDTNSNFSSSRFTPTVAGYYQINYEVDVYGAGSNVYGVVALYKNGISVKRGSGISATNPIEVYFVLSALVYMNGTTDYVEIYPNINSAGTITLNGGGPIAGYFQGFLARTA